MADRSLLMIAPGLSFASERIVLEKNSAEATLPPVKGCTSIGLQQFGLLFRRVGFRIAVQFLEATISDHGLPKEHEATATSPKSSR